MALHTGLCYTGLMLVITPSGVRSEVIYQLYLVSPGPISNLVFSLSGSLCKNGRQFLLHRIIFQKCPIAFFYRKLTHISEIDPHITTTCQLDTSSLIAQTLRVGWYSKTQDHLWRSQARCVIWSSARLGTLLSATLFLIYIMADLHLLVSPVFKPVYYSTQSPSYASVAIIC